MENQNERPILRVNVMTHCGAETLKVEGSIASIKKEENTSTGKVRFRALDSNGGVVEDFYPESCAYSIVY